MTTTTHLVRGLSRAEFIALMAAMMACNAMAIDIMLPAFPQIASAMGVDDPNNVQLVLIAYLIGFGVGQLVLGPVSDHFGRRSPVLVGLVVYAIAAVAAIFSPSFGVMLALRFTQGLGAAATRITALSVIRDTYSGRRMAEAISLVFMVFMVVPVIAPAIGQGLVLVGSWELIFVAMALMAIAVLIWGGLRLPETLPTENRRALTYKVVVEGFRLVFSNRLAMMYGLAPAIVMGGLFSMISTVQPIYVNIYGLGPWFPLAFGAAASALALSSLINSRIVNRLGMRRISHGALLAFIILSTIWVIWSSATLIPLPAYITLMSLLMFTFGMMNNNFNALAMEPLGKVAGTAASVFGFMQTFGGAVIGGLIGQTYNGTTTPIGIGYMVLGALAMTMVLVAERGRLFGIGVEDPPPPAR